MASDSVFLFVANPGGHIDELVRLSNRLQTAGAPVIWVTGQTTQTKSLMEGRTVEFVPNVAPRQLGRAVASVPGAAAQIKRLGITHVVSTGSALAVPYLVAARLLGRSFTFIESAARQRAPSLTGRLAQVLPGVDRRTQAAHPFNRKWTSAGSVFDGYLPSSGRSRPVRRIVVSLGGEKFPFERAVHRIRQIVPDGVHVTWQLGTTRVAGLSADAAWVKPRLLRAAMREADAVLVHAGVGSALAALDCGRLPILLVRQHRHGEHVDDHQKEIADALVARGLAVAPQIEELTWADVVAAARRFVKHEEVVTPIFL